MGWNKWVAALVIVAGVLGTVRAAKADPHAVFYTAIAQQQLFYNVLAALDQADYVETQYARVQLLKKRAEEEVTPAFKDEDFPLTEATKIGKKNEDVSQTDPGIANLLTRLITLEGTDLYDDQLVREFGAESGRRNATSELLRTLCDYGLGFENCEDDITGKAPEEIAAAENYRRRAIVNDPLEWASVPFFEGVVGALSSGLEKDKELRAERLDNPSDPRGGLPRAYSAEIHKWRNKVGENLEQSELLENLLLGVASDYVLLDTAEYPYENIEFSPNGVPEIYVPGGGKLTAEKVTDVAQRVLTAPLKARELAEEAAARVALQQQMIEDEGLLGDVKLKSNPVEDYSDYGELTYLVNNPVAVKKADVYSLPVALALLDTSQQASSLAGLDEPGSQQLVKRVKGPEGPGGVVYGAGEVAGIGIAAGKSLGELDLFDEGKYAYDELKEPTSPSANIIAGHLEQGAVQALRILTAGGFREDNVKKCGWTCP